MTTTTWKRTLSDLTGWLETDKLASPKKEDVRLSPRHQEALARSMRSTTKQRSKCYRVVLTVEEEDINTGETRTLDDFSLVVSPVLSTRDMTALQWVHAKILIEREEQ